MNVRELLEAGRKAHRAGRFREAELAYRQALAADPRQAEAWHLLGLIAQEGGQPRAALEHVERALALAPGAAAFWNSHGLLLGMLGQREKAAESFARAVSLAPDHAEAHSNLGAILSEQGRSEQAVEHFREAARLRPDLLAAALNLGRTLQRLGRLDEAGAVLDEAARRHGQIAEPCYLLSLVHRDQGRAAEEIACLREALRRRAQYPEALNQLGIALARSGQLAEALEALREALRIQPGYADAYNNVGNVLKRMGRPDEAESAYLHAVRCDPGSADLQVSVAMLLLDRGRAAEALVSLRHAERLQSNRPDVWRATASALTRLGRTRDAVRALGKVLELAPGDREALNDLGNLLQELDQFHEAEAAYRKAIERNPDFAAAQANLAYLLADQGRTAEAREHYGRALEAKPSTILRVLSETVLPVIYQSADEIRRTRAALEQSLARLNAEGVRIDPTREAIPTLFYLAYQGLDDRKIHEDLARLCAVTQSAQTPRGAAEGGKLRVGFLSRYLRDHTIGRLTEGMIRELSRETFRVSVLSVGQHDDELGRRIRASADRYVVLPQELPAALALTSDEGLDVLVYTDLGMAPLTYAMAFSRLAPVQCAFWGHPMTTGSPVIDYFLSSEDLEPAGAEKHYSERLVRMRRLSVYYRRPARPEPLKPRRQFDLPEEAHIYGCPQTLFKFHPEFDPLLAEILGRDPRAMLVMLEGRYPSWQELLVGRFRRALPGLEGRIRFLPKLAHNDYLNVLTLCDVLLDPVHFGGGNSSYEGLALGVPIVTLPSAFLRGRITYAQYRQMGLMDCVAESPEDYVRLAVELGTNAKRRAAVAEQILARGGVLFEDREAVTEMEQFLAWAGRRARQEAQPAGNAFLGETGR